MLCERKSQSLECHNILIKIGIKRDSGTRKYNRKQNECDYQMHHHHHRKTYHQGCLVFKTANKIPTAKEKEKNKEATKAID